jgi:PAS domain S-box-containing protein
MGEFGSVLAYLRDPRLTTHATSALPAWLWSSDATRVLWANPTAAAIFDAPSSMAIAGYIIDPKGTAALQVARLAGSLPHGASPRLERLRGMGGRFGRALMCACSRVTLADRTSAILVVATELAGPDLSLEERVCRLFAGCEEPIALFSGNGALLHATTAALAVLRGRTTLAALGAARLAEEALAAGNASGGSQFGEIAVERIGTGASAVLMVTLPHATPAAKPITPVATTPHDVPAPVVATPAPPKPTAVIPTEPPRASLMPAELRQPLRFVWQMDADGCFTLGSDEFAKLIGPRSAAVLGRPWNEIAMALALDPEGHVARAIASRDTWSGIVVTFPVDGTAKRLAVELSGLPVFDRDRNFRGYRGFGVCREVDLPERPEAQPIAAPSKPAPESKAAAEPRPEPPPIREERPALSLVPPVENVVPFRASGPAEKPPALTPVERKAFRELASRLTARLRDAGEAGPNDAQIAGEPETAAPEALAPEALAPEAPAAPEPLPAPAPVVAAVPVPKIDERAGTHDQRPILDRLPVGVLVYRLDKLIYANRAFLDWTGYEHIHALSDAGGLDALFVEPNGNAPRENNGAKVLTIATNRGDQLPVEARLFTTPWEGESALVLMLANANAPTNGRPAATDTVSDTDLREAKAEARELRAILDTATDGVVVLDREGRVISINRSAETLFGYESRELNGLPFAGLLAPESQRVAFDAIDRLNRAAATSGLDDGREIIARVRRGGLVPMFMTIGRIADNSDRICAVFRDITPWKKAEADLLDAKRQAEKASSAKSEFLAKVSHEIRTPLNAIIGFSEVMMEERFGAISNDRYKQYLRDIHTSGGHLISLLNDLLDLSKIEAGKLELSFASIDLNELTQQCVALMQPQANRERIIIRTSLASALSPVLADARSVRQIVLNLLSNSIKFTGAGGQVIVSTAVSDGGDVVLRVRDTGVGMSEKEIAIALEPFRQLATSARWGSSGTGLGLPLTKALAEANRATFSIKSAVNAGTLVEVAFPGTQLAAE